MAFKFVACRSHLPGRFVTGFKNLRIRVSRASFQVGNNPRNDAPLSEDSTSRAGHDRKSNMPDAAEMVKEGITNVIDVAQTIGKNTKEAVDTVWESTNEGANTVKEKIKDSGNARSKDDIEAAAESGIEDEWKRRLHHRP